MSSDLCWLRSDLAACALWLLVWICPIFSFCANNIDRFTSRQVVGSLLLSICLSCLCGIGSVHLPEVVAALIAGLVFCSLSEKLIHLFVQQSLIKAIIFLITGAFFALIAHFFGLWPLCALLFIYLCFSFADFVKNLHKPKHAMPMLQRPGEKSIVVIDDKDNPLPRMATTPNIYLLFLESIHSAKTLKKIYGIDDAGLGEFLQNKGFTIFSRSCSNEYGTTVSLNTILNMSSEGWKPLQDAPPAFRWLKASGYTINLIDCALYTFAHYVPYCDYFNFSMPRWVEKLYIWFLPFFLQSSLLTRLTCNIDPFTDESDFSEARHSLLRRMQRESHSPSFYIVRFGAGHVPNHYTWKEKNAWDKKYIALYSKAVHQIKEIIDAILTRDPDGCIIAMGDHGAASWQGVWQGKKDCNANMRANGVEPSVVSEDLTGILLAMRMPGKNAVPDQPITPSNLFRLVFEYNGVLPEHLPAIPSNFSYLHEPSNPVAFILAKNAEPLTHWELDTPAAGLARKTGTGSDLYLSSINELLEIADYLESSGEFEVCLKLLERGMDSFPPSAKLHLALSRLYVRMGMASKSLPLLEKYIDMNEEALGMFARSIALTGHAGQALKILAAHPLSKKMPPRQFLYRKADLLCLDGRYEDAALCLRECLSLPSGHISELVGDANALALCLDCLGRTDEALAELDRICSKAAKPAALATIFLLAASLGMRTAGYQDTSARILKAFETSREPYPLTLYLWQAGLEERCGNPDQALKYLITARDARPPAPFLLAQIGLFLIRNDIAAGSLHEEKKAGYAYLRMMKDVFSIVFDKEFYSNKYSHLISKTEMAPLTHYIHYGRLLALDPNRLFNQIFYLVTQKDIFFYGYDPLYHFLICPSFENRNPSKQFDIQAYMARCSYMDWKNTNTLVHAMHTTT
ncbi:hypothetical protein [Desulfovibrio sp. ZJ200]|uniref:tetratricopeptide repeat protein n=1 Tax=Desulfovibrio sp. ZJ200 TaxID=2709792 RepID=UPI0013EBB6BF|nr:hypothetical protein [Desulfovibrio sp. ZJ200]